MARPAQEITDRNLIAAAERGDLAGVRTLLDRGARIEA
jgi:hypothetical protein